MIEPGQPSLLDAGRDELSSGFNPLQLWRDRQRILADPEIAAQPRPPLANAPLRYALALSLTPLLVVAWLTSSLAGWMPRNDAGLGMIEARSAVTIEVLGEQLPGLDVEQVKVLARSIRARDMVAEAAVLRRDAKDTLVWNLHLLPDARR